MGTVEVAGNEDFGPKAIIRPWDRRTTAASVCLVTETEFHETDMGLFTPPVIRLDCSGAQQTHNQVQQSKIILIAQQVVVPESD